MKPGDKVGALTVIAASQSSMNGAAFECRCDCGRLVTRRAADLRKAQKRGSFSTCGCGRAAAMASKTGQKKCPRCEVEKSLSEFAKDSRAKLGVQVYCRDCCAIWRQENADYLQAAKAKDYKENRPARIAANLKAQRRNKAASNARSKKWREANQEKRKESVKAWARRNRPRMNAFAAKRRAAKRSATPSWADNETINDFYLEASELGLEIDHIVPLQHPLVCGLHVEHNLQAIPMRLNRQKSNNYWPDMP